MVSSSDGGISAFRYHLATGQMYIHTTILGSPTKIARRIRRKRKLSGVYRFVVQHSTSMLEHSKWELALVYQISRKQDCWYCKQTALWLWIHFVNRTEGIVISLAYHVSGSAKLSSIHQASGRADRRRYFSWSAVYAPLQWSLASSCTCA